MASKIILFINNSKKMVFDLTIYEQAIKTILTKEIIHISKTEKISQKEILKGVSKGRIVIMKREGFNPIGIGYPLKTKINVNLGTSSSKINIDEEFEKVKLAQKYGADTISDLSMGGDIDSIRREILKLTILPLTTVPIYQSVVEAGSALNVSEELIFSVLEKQLKDGISSIVIHAGFTLDDLNSMKGKRIMKRVSKGGTLTASIMKSNNSENPFLANFNHILELIKDYDVVLSLGNAMRPGCIHDKVDKFQISEIKTNNKLAKLANKHGIQVILESLGGHINANDIIKWVKRHKKITNNRPLFVSGPLPIDIGTGYDHISAALGGAFATGFGADYICAITPAEHLSLPSLEDIKNGLIASKIAAHVGDSMKYGLNHLFNDDLNLAKNRFLKNWKKQFEYILDPEEAIKKHNSNGNKDICTMCGNHCALSLSKKIL
jgi:phosphomethylpyrimidine synthase